jgi:PPK2 family polyphosphate:nucleotide phosphotransferase
MEYAQKFDGDEQLRLSESDTIGDTSIEKDAGEEELQRLTKELGDLQELLYAAGTDALLIILQGMDTAGKDGTIRKVLAEMDPQGVNVTSFKVPTELEREHDFLWRHHTCTPWLSMVGVFNRSYYEAVVVEAVKEIATPEQVASRYPHINDFELLLTQSHTIVAKFFLHISKETQRERLLDRQESVETAWKLSAGDWQERARWDEYQAAYEAAINATATSCAPWYVVPSDRKWYRNLAVAQVLVELLRPCRDAWIATLRQRSEQELAAITEARAAHPEWFR